jgi:hypothetical protein
MNKLVSISALSLAICGAALAGPPTNVQGGWSGTNGYILATTTGLDRSYTCKYKVTVYYVDGTTHSTNGQTQPQSGSTNGRVVEIQGSKRVKSVSVDSWSCS